MDAEAKGNLARGQTKRALTESCPVRTTGVLSHTLVFFCFSNETCNKLLLSRQQRFCNGIFFYFHWLGEHKPHKRIESEHAHHCRRTKPIIAVLEIPATHSDRWPPTCPWSQCLHTAQHCLGYLSSYVLLLLPLLLLLLPLLLLSELSPSFPGTCLASCYVCFLACAYHAEHCLYSG